MASGYVADDIGRGVSIDRLEVPLRPVIDVDLLRPSPPDSATRNESVVFFRTTQDIQRGFSVSSGLDVRALAQLRANTTIDFSQLTTTSENSVSFAYFIHNNFGRITYRGQINAGFRKFLDEGKTRLAPNVLAEQVRQLYGTHYIRGARLEHFIVAIFQYNFSSKNEALDFRLNLERNYKDGLISSDFRLSVTELLRRNRASESLAYQFVSSDALQPNFPRTASITNIDQFNEFMTKAGDYADRLTNYNTASKTAYIVERIDTLQDYDGPTLASTPQIGGGAYKAFSDVARDAKTLLDRIDYARQPLAAQWLNPKGQRYLAQWRAEVGAYYDALTNNALAHFESGQPLTLPGDPLNIQASAHRVSLSPRISVVDRFRSGSGHHEAAVGFVDFGPADTVDPTAIKSIYLGKPDGSMEQRFTIAHSQQELDALMAKFVSDSSDNLEAIDVKASQFWSTSDIWKSVLANSSGSRGIFTIPILRYNSDPDWRIYIKDGYGNVLDIVNPAVLTDYANSRKTEAGLIADVGVTLKTKRMFLSPGEPVAFSFAVTNAGPGAAHGVKLTIPLPVELGFESVSSGQGSGSLVGDDVEVNLGPLASGAGTTIILTLLPNAEDVVAGIVGRASIEAEMVDPAPENDLVSSSLMKIGLPELGISSSLGALALKWEVINSAAPEPVLEQRDSSGPEGGWRQSVAEVRKAGLNREASFVPQPGKRVMFWRLKVD